MQVRRSLLHSMSNISVNLLIQVPSIVTVLYCRGARSIANDFISARNSTGNINRQLGAYVPFSAAAPPFDHEDVTFGMPLSQSPAEPSSRAELATTPEDSEDR